MTKRIPLWEHFPQKYWTEADWRHWERHGRKRVPIGLRLDADVPQRLDVPPVVQPPHPFDGFDLSGQRSKGNNTPALVRSTRCSRSTRVDGGDGGSAARCRGNGCAVTAPSVSWLSSLAALVPTLGADDDIRDLNWVVVAGVRVSLGSEVDPNERVFSGV